MSDSIKCFVRVLGAVAKSYPTGVYKEVTVLQETGFWMNIFKVNFFPNQPLYEKLEEGLQMLMEVKEYSKNYKTLLTAEENQFAECRVCKRYHDGHICLCPNDEAIRIQGEWTLIELQKAEKYSKLHFQQGNERLCHVLFNNDSPIQYSENKVYQLKGWQKKDNRHNIIVIQ